MVGAGKNHALDALAPGRLEDVITTDDVGLVYDLPGVLDRHAAQVDDRIDPRHRRLDLGEIAQIGGHQFLARPGFAERRDIGEAQDRIGAAQALAQSTADDAGGTGDQNPCRPHHLVPPCPLPY